MLTWYSISLLSRRFFAWRETLCNAQINGRVHNWWICWWIITIWVMDIKLRAAKNAVFDIFMRLIPAKVQQLKSSEDLFFLHFFGHCRCRPSTNYHLIGMFRVWNITDMKLQLMQFNRFRWFVLNLFMSRREMGKKKRQSPAVFCIFCDQNWWCSDSLCILRDCYANENL